MEFVSESILKLPPFSSRTLTKDSLNQEKVKKRVGKSLNTCSDFVGGWNKKGAKRELVQNLLDETARSNGTPESPSLEGIQIGIGNNTTVFHNGKHKFSEIIYIPKHDNPKENYFNCETKDDDKSYYGTLEFINYGALFPAGRKILFYGTTDKRNLRNQAGKYGEGLKRAITLFLTKGYGVDIFAIVPEKDKITSQHWRFFLGKNSEVLYTISANKQHFKDAFRLVITFPDLEYANGLDFNLYDHIIPKEHLNNEGIIFDEALRGTVYSHHFFVGKGTMKYCYDVPINIGRDRNRIDWEEFTQHVAQKWSCLLIKNRERALEFFELIMDSRNSSSLVEMKCLDHLTKEARVVLVELFCLSFQDMQPILQGEDAEIFDCPTIECPDKLYHAITGSEEPFFKSVKKWKELFMIGAQPLTDAQIEHTFIDVFKGKVKLEFTVSESHLRYVAKKMEEGHVLFIVPEKRKSEDILNLICDIGFRWLPKCLGHFDYYPIMMQISDIMAERKLKRQREEEEEEEVREVRCRVEEPDDNIELHAYVTPITGNIEFFLPQKRGYHWCLVAKKF